MSAPPFDLPQAHRWFAVEMNNMAWDLIEQPNRGADENERLISSAHAARMHWSQVGKELNELRAETLLATAYLAVGRAELSLHHAERARAISQMVGDEQAPFDRASVHGSLAAALLRLARAEDARREYATALTWVERFDHPDERGIFEKLYPAP
jgi:hypothetical protein